MTTIPDVSAEAGVSAPVQPPLEERDPPREYLYRANFGADMAIREVADGGPRILYGHFARFNEWTKIDSRWEGTFMERIAPGAFKKTFDENASRIRVLFQHGRDVLGQQVLGNVRELREDEQGAYYEVELHSGIPSLLLSGLRSGSYGASFRFKSIREDYTRDVETSDHNPDGIPERTIVEAAVPEFGPVTFPAYQGATAGVRSISDEILLDPLVEERLREIAEQTHPAPSTPTPADEPPREERREPTITFDTREDYLEWLTSQL